MADFYIKYGSNEAKLVGSFRYVKNDIKFYRLKSGKFIISKNRKIVYETYNADIAEKKFYDFVEFSYTDCLTFIN